MAKSWSLRGASHHPSFMVSSLTVSQTHLPCPPCGKMGLQPWPVAVAIIQLWNLKLDLPGSMLVMSLSSHFWSPGSTQQRCQSYSVLLPWNWLVQMMGEIMRLCIGDVSWLLQNGSYWGFGNGGAGVCGQTVEDVCDSLLMPVCGSGGGGQPLGE